MESKKNIETTLADETSIDDIIIELQTKFDEAIKDRDIEKTKILMAKALALVKDDKSLEKFQKAQIYYSIATSYSNLELIFLEDVTDENKEMSLYYFRKSIEIVESLDPTTLENKDYYYSLKSQLYTNYGILHSRVSRPIQAIKLFTSVLNDNPNFDMAIGNLGNTFLNYGRNQYFDFHKHSINYMAYRFLLHASSSQSNADTYAKKAFLQRLEVFDKDYINDYLLIHYPYREINPPIYDCDEKNYRKKILDLRLFLSPLNDLFYLESHMDIDDMDIVALNQTTANDFNHMFNSIKQEYISARY